jgi:4-deoxy-L-threo-5-hexosulose-uronate ketol-isomerase
VHTEVKKQFAIHPDHAKGLDTQSIREHFLLETLFAPGKIRLHYSFYDRMIAGGIMPLKNSLALETIDELKASYFLERREIGVINVGGTGAVIVDGKEFILENKEALYLGRGAKEVLFSNPSDQQALFYFNSCPAHAEYPTKKISIDEAETVTIGSQETANHRTIRKLIVQSTVQTCQVQMGMTELHSGSIWNTMPPHTHDRRMEVYFYFNVPEGNAICHFLGEPHETRHIWMQNYQAVWSPPWSIHAGAGTSAYTFIWGMAGENLDYTDMDGVKLNELR